MKSILRDSDRCVLCGMCLPHCPTFQMTGLESEGPRGRIALAQALARDRLPVDEVLADHFDRCLGCRACEAMCPSEVPYARILGAARRLVSESRPASFAQRLTAGALSQPRLLKTALMLGRSALAKRIGADSSVAPLTHLASLRAPSTIRLPEHTAAVGPERGRVALFLGCTGEALDGEALSASVYLLSAFGFRVTVPRAQTCCGAMHHGHGDGKGFERRARANLRAFSVNDVDAIVTIASGCGALLSEYGEWIEGPEAADFGRKVREITAFLAEEAWPEGLCPAPLGATAAVHVPCTQRNVLRRPEASRRLLGHVPDLELIDLPGNDRCCGAAGMHMLEQPETAASLRSPKLEALAALKAQYLISTNVGCAVHLATGARERGQTVEVIHPISLLARALAPDRNSH